MPVSRTTSCPRCHNTFACMAGDIPKCRCSKISLSHEDKKYIASYYHDCLCPGCLSEIKEELQAHKNQQLGKNSPQ